jgi:hypothetical protein
MELTTTNNELNILSVFSEKFLIGASAMHVQKQSSISEHDSNQLQPGNEDDKLNAEQCRRQIAS